MAFEFNAHGSGSVTVDGNFIMIEASGPWNKELFDQLHADLIDNMAKVDRNNYGVYVKMLDDCLVVNEAIAEHINYIKQGNTKAIAVDLGQCNTAALTKEIFGNIYNEGGVTHQFFTESQAALNWLRQQLD